MAKREQKNQKEHGDGLLAGAAKAIGGIAGTLAHAIGAGGSHQAAGSEPAGPKRGKLQPKNKSRLPRRAKKAQKKAGNRQAA